MRRVLATIFVSIALSVVLMVQSCGREDGEVERPERVVSKREVVYDKDTYERLAALWKKYYDRFPSEDAYANWMYAARYADDPEYESLVQEGVDKFPANPVILYLASMQAHGARENKEAQLLLEKATRLDPGYMEPWFSLAIHYMIQENMEQLDVALSRLLEGGVIADEIMDYSYNMFACLDKDAILITNGDNDTYPGWILTRVLKHRTDVSIVNRSLLNTDWYPAYIIKQGLPSFITEGKLDTLRASIAKEIEEKRRAVTGGGPFGDTLVVRLIEAARRAGRPAYFSETLFRSEMLDPYRSRGRHLGLVTLVSPPHEPYRIQLRRVLNAWLREFRTGGIDGWNLQHAKTTRAGRQLTMNYASALYHLMDSITVHTPELRLEMFNWYRNHLMNLVPSKDADKLHRDWCRSTDILQIEEWCRKQNYIE